MRKSLTARWNHVRSTFALSDLLLDITGKVLVALGLGVWLAPILQPYVWLLIIAGVVVSLTVKAKYWKQFWS